MAIPDFQSIMLPLLKFAADRGGEVSMGDACDVCVRRTAYYGSRSLTEDLWIPAPAACPDTSPPSCLPRSRQASR